MVETIVGLYLQSLVVTVVGMLLFCAIWFVWRTVRKKDQTAEARRGFLYDLLLIFVMTVPILAFGVVGLILMLMA